MTDELREALDVPARPVTEPGLQGLYALPLDVIDARTVAARRWADFPTDEDVEAAAEAIEAEAKKWPQEDHPLGWGQRVPPSGATMQDLARAALLAVKDRP
jgi:hypothetical protein